LFIPDAANCRTLFACLIIHHALFCMSMESKAAPIRFYTSLIACGPCATASGSGRRNTEWSFEEMEIIHWLVGTEGRI
jgi:hypothetical protein